MDLDVLIPSFGTAAAAAIAFRALFVAEGTEAGLRGLAGQLGTLSQRLGRLDERLAGPPAVESSTEAPAQPVAEPKPAPGSGIKPDEVHQEQDTTGQTASESPSAPPPQSETSLPAPNGAQLERMLVENWLVWVGGLALALGGAFLVKLSIDHNLLTPVARVILGVLLGLTMSGVAEWLARRDRPDADESWPSYVPQALAAAGSVTVFASLYAAYRLYGLLPSPVAFALLTTTAAATVVASLRHGEFVAALGLVGAFAVPMLVESEAPHALPLFSYLTVVSAASLVLLRYREWWWLAAVWLAAAVLWVLIWLASTGGREAVIVGGFLLIQFALFGMLRRGVPGAALFGGISEQRVTRITVRTGFWLLVALMHVTVSADGFGLPILVCALLAVIFLLWFAYHDSAFDDAIAPAAALPLTLLALWPLPPYRPPIESVLPVASAAELVNFIRMAVVGTLVLGGVVGLLPRVARPGRWAALSAAAPLLILMIAYWRLDRLGVDTAWSSTALALATLELAAASWVAKRRNGSIEWEIALASYALGVLGGTILATTFALSNAWLTVALALHLPALGWVEGRIRLPILRTIALGIGSSVLTRLALNPAILSYPLSATPIFNWLLYGYGVPAIAFIAATRQFGSRADDRLVRVLEAGAILFTTLLLTLELRHFLYGRIDAPLLSLGRDSWQALVWLSLSALLFRLGQSRERLVLRWGCVILFGLASLQTVFWQSLVANPLSTGAPVGRWIVLDAMTVAYGLPALLYAGMGYWRLGPQPLPAVSRYLAVVFAFLWLTLEVRHGFRGEVLRWGTAGEAEWYAYSAAWLAFAGGALAIALLRQDQWFRRLALAGIGLVIAKVFLSDMAQLSGALRALSFLALGSVLVGIGYAYRRLRPVQGSDGQNGMPLIPSEG
jgi:uncharacterized membrane protein